MQFCCQLLLLFTVLFVIQIAFLPYGSANAEEIIPIAQSSVLKLLQCLVEYDYKQKARPIREMPRNELASNDEVKGPEGKKQMEYFMSAYFEIEEFISKCTEKDKQLNQLIKSAILSDSNPAGSIKESNGKRLKYLQLKSEMTNQQSPKFIEKGKEWLKKEFNEIKTAGGWIYENRGSPWGVFGTRSNKFQKALRFWRRFLTPYSLAVKGSILEVAKILFVKLQEKTKSHTLIEAIKMLFGKMKEIFGSPEHLHFNWELKRIEDEFEADKLITKYTYHNYYVGDEDKFVPREETGEVDKDGKKIYESIEAHEEKNTYFDKAYKNHLENIENLMKKVEIVPDNVMGPHVPNSLPFPLAIPKANRVFWIVRRLSAPKEDKDLSKDQISLIKSDLTNAFEHIPIKKMNIIMVEYKKQDPVEDTPENKKKFKDINEENKKREKANAEGPRKMETKNKEAEITARHILGKRNLGKQKVEITKIGPMKEKKQYVQGEPFGPGDDDDLPTTIDIMKIVTGTAENVHPPSTDEASSSHHGKDAATATGSLLTEEEIKKIMSHQKSKQPAFNAKDWLAPGEEKKEHIVLVADLALILALQQLVDSKYKYAAPGCILKLVEVEGGSSHAQNGLENGLQGLRLINGGIYKHLGKLGEHKDKAFFEKYFTN